MPINRIFIAGYRAARRWLSEREHDDDEDPDERRRKAMRTSSEIRRCPACGRSGALREVAVEGTTALRCRWCQWEARQV